MSNLKLIKETDTSLRQQNTNWDWEQDGEVADLAQSMLKFMFENDGIGLAAPQLGINKRLFVMGNQAQSYICVNPEITSTLGEIKDLEGCLSFPGLWLHVTRPESVDVKYQDILGRWHEKTFRGLQARIFLHEYDHLEGICFVDKVGKLSLELAQKRRKKNLKRI